VFQLPFNVVQQPTRSEAEHSDLIQDGPSSSFISASIDGLLGSADSSRRFEAYGHSGFPGVFADTSCHTNPTGNVALVGSFPVEVLMKSAPAIMATKLARPRSHGQQIAGAENYFHMR